MINVSADTNDSWATPSKTETNRDNFEWILWSRTYGALAMRLCMVKYGTLPLRPLITQDTS